MAMQAASRVAAAKPPVSLPILNMCDPPAGAEGYHPLPEFR
jgi:hypothetical protein